MSSYSSHQQGVVATLTLFGVTAVVLAIMSTLALVSIGELKMSQQGDTLEQTFYAAEAGLNEALYRLITNPALASQSYQTEDYQVDLSILPNPDNPYQRIVRSQATDSQGRVRTVQVIANTSSFGSGFDYAVQGGAGGVYLDNNSLVIGGIYSNGDILPASGGARGNIQGDVWAADFHQIQRVNVTGNAHANTILDSDIQSHAFYQNIDNQTLVGGQPCPNQLCHASSSNPEIKDFPVSAADVQLWKDDIDALADTLEPNPDDCPQSYSQGFYCVTTNGQLGNQKINGGFYVGNGATLTLTGNLWVTGDIMLDNNGTIQIDPALGGVSLVVIADGIIDINNNYIIQNSGVLGSFVLMLSMNPSHDLSAPAIYASNNSDSIIFAALQGMLKVKNNGNLNAAVAETLYLEPNAQVTYDPLLSFFIISSGGGNTVGTALGSWQEL
jgi:hypothetical protein